MGWRDALLIGCAQALALMPGTSRSGVTMTMARTLGLTREGAARFSFLLAVPGIGMAGAYELLKLVSAQRPERWTGRDGLGVVVAAITGYFCIAWLLRVINRIGLAPFAIYRFALAGLMFWLVRLITRRLSAPRGGDGAAARRSSRPVSPSRSPR